MKLRLLNAAILLAAVLTVVAITSLLYPHQHPLWPHGLSHEPLRVVSEAAL